MISHLVTRLLTRSVSFILIVCFSNLLSLAQSGVRVPDPDATHPGVVVQDEGRRAAESAYSEGERFRRQETVESLQKAIQRYQEALLLWRTAADRRGEAKTLVGIGITLRLVGKNHEALEHHNQALLIWRSLGDRRTESDTLHTMGLIARTLGENQEALDYYGRALAIKREIGDTKGEAHALNGLAIVYHMLDENQKALDNFGQALLLARSEGDGQSEAYALNNMGNVLLRLGEAEKALEFYLKALRVRQSLGDRRGEANTLANIGFIYTSLKETRKALEHFDRALSLTRAIGNSRGEALCLSGIAGIHASLGESQRALDYYDQALTRFRAVGDRQAEAETLGNFGFIYASLKEHARALAYFEQALALQRATGDRHGEAVSLFGLALTEKGRGRFDEARAHVETALDAVESSRGKLVSPNLRASFVASNITFYEFYVDLLMRMHQRQPSAGHHAAALRANERARARSLLETLTEARADIRQGVEPRLLEREANLQRQINAKAERLRQLLDAKHTEEQAEAVRKDLDALLMEFQGVQAQIRTNSPRYAALTQPYPLNLREIQQQVLDHDTLLLEYALGEERSYLWAVTQSSITTYELPKRTDIEALARSVYWLLTERNRVEKGETAESRLARARRADAQYHDAALNLSRMILQPAAGELGSKRLVVVGEGVLQYLPFAALPNPAAAAEKGGRRLPLVAKHEIVTLPSASVLAVLRKELSGREPAHRTLAVLADPVFESKDPRVGLAQAVAASADARPVTAGAAAPPPSEVERSAEESGAGELRRLYFSSREAKQIASFAPEGGKLVALDFAASLEAVRGAELSRYRIVHFATHGLLNNRHPELSGIVLSLVDERGRPRDGFLRLNEIYNMKLGADLVVLSACQTALGKEIRGEGLVGITRGFMYAGSPRVVASLWKVDDRATAELMSLFYRAMLEEKLTPAAALKRAQKEMSKKWPSPYYWAGFTLQGEWR